MENEKEYQSDLIVKSSFPEKRINLEAGMGLFAIPRVWDIVTEVNETVETEELSEGTCVGRICWQGEEIIARNVDEQYLPD